MSKDPVDKESLEIKSSSTTICEYLVVNITIAYC